MATGLPAIFFQQPLPPSPDKKSKSTKKSSKSTKKEQSKPTPGGTPPQRKLSQTSPDVIFTGHNSPTVLRNPPLPVLSVSSLPPLVAGGFSLRTTPRTILHEVLEDPGLCVSFQKYLQGIYTSENLTFLLEVEYLKTLETPRQRMAYAKKIFNDYLDENAPFMLSIERSVVSEITKKLESGVVDESFDIVSSDLVHLLETTLLPKYLQSDYYRHASGEMAEVGLSPLIKANSAGSLHSVASNGQCGTSSSKGDKMNRMINLPSVLTLEKRTRTTSVGDARDLASPRSKGGMLSILNMNMKKNESESSSSFSSSSGPPSPISSPCASPSTSCNIQTLVEQLEQIENEKEDKEREKKERRDKLYVDLDKAKKKDHKTKSIHTSRAKSPDRVKEREKEKLSAELFDLLSYANFEFSFLLCEEEIRAQSPKCEDVLTSMLDLFESKCCVEQFIQHRLFTELTLNSTPAGVSPTIFREESILTKMVSKYFGMKGRTFLCSILNPLIASIANNGSFEIDPDKINPGDNITSNALKLNAVTTDFFSRLFLRVDQFPVEIRRLGALIRRVVWKVSPDNPQLERLIVGNLFFLRFLCPMLATTQSDQHGHPLTRDTRRACVLVSKLLQNLVAGVEFDGTKENYMCCLNVFITGQQDNINSFIRRFTDELSIPALFGSEKLTPEQKAQAEANILDSICRNQDRLWEALLTPERLHLVRRMKFFSFYGVSQATTKMLS
eukprot:TRINITY_DN11819_c0_g1_i1.p1 TRINITY_DN11819_c0_g1~~TRINITY_DN11819_c0_g1_i1.p1  ORF type:complete len:727 (-),score=141.98 TRINITY_DN11819_c0_g1_i1:143-2323(-)